MKLTLKTTEFIPANKIKIPDIYYNRMKTGITELDDFLGGSTESTGGFLRGGVYFLVAGAGSGKSTFCLQTAEALLNRGHRVAYASGEESIEQLAFSCNRLSVKNVPVAVKTDIKTICEKMKDLDVIFIDSFQTLTVSKNMTPRKKELFCIRELCATAKATGCTVIALCHLTKAGVYKGSTTVLHAIDACISITIDEEDTSLRLFTWNKNRFGPSDKEMLVALSRTGYLWTDIVTEPAKPVKNKVDIFEDIAAFKSAANKNEKKS